MRIRVLVAAVAALLAYALAADAQNSRRQRQDPELVVENGDRTGACDDLRFTPDGKRLLAIGDDKVVRVWSFADGNIDSASVRALRWGIWREQRGAIYCMALSPNGRRVAVGGVGDVTSRVALLDLDSGDMVDAAIADGAEARSITAFWAAAFAPSGKRVAFGAGDGGVWLWDLDQSALQFVGRPDAAPAGKALLLRFEDENTILCLTEDGRLLRWTVGRARPEQVMKLAFPVYKAELSPDGRRLAAAAKGPLVTVRSLTDEKDFRDIKLKGFETFRPGQKDGEYPGALAFAPDGRLAVAVGSLVPGADFAVEADSRIAFYDLTPAELKPAPGPPHHYRAERLAFHPDGKVLAVAGGENQEVTLWNTGDFARPLNVLVGPGRCLWDVAFSEDGALGFRDRRDPASTNPNARGLGPWRAFDPAQREWLAEADFKPVPRLDKWRGWTVQPDAKNPFVWSAVHESGASNLLPIDEATYDRPRCWTFLPSKDGPVRLAVGHYWGFSVFELDAAAKAAKRVRLCVGHQGEVVALGPSADGKQVASCSNDMTIAVWDVAKQWPSKTVLGATFEPKGRRLVVKSVDVGGPAWEAGLQAGDEVVQLGQATGWVDGGPATWQPLLAAAEPGVVYSFDVERNGVNVTADGKEPFITTLKQRPLWKFYPAGGDEWVLWMWRNSFYDSSTKGDYGVGWHVNSPDGKRSPHFYKVEQFRRYFRRRDVINNLIDTGDPAQALAVLGNNPVPLHFDEMEPPAAVVALGPVQPGKDVTATLSAYARGDNDGMEPEDAELWINDYRVPLDKPKVQSWPRDDKGARSLAVAIPRDKLRGGDNLVTFQTWNKLGGRTDATATVPGDHAPPESPRLIGVVVGVNEYGNQRPDVMQKGVLYDLDYAARDAQTLADALKAQKLYSRADVTTLLDRQVTRQAVLDALDDLAKKASADDTCVVFLSGHGDYREEKSAISGGAPRSELVFCLPGYNLNKPDVAGISDEVLFRKLSAIPCRKLLLLDACHAGAALGALDSPARGFAPGGQGPIILAACDRKQSSLEHPVFGHGLFTQAILDALDDPTHYPDHHGVKELFATELFRDVTDDMPKLLGQIKERTGEQVPVLFAPNGEDVLVARG